MPETQWWTGGGVATLFKSHLNVKRYTLHHTYETFGSVFTIVKHNNLNFLLGSIYRVPTNVTFQNFMNEFTDLLMLLAYEQRPVILAGDFNVKINLPHSSDTSPFLLLFLNLTFLPSFLAQLHTALVMFLTLPLFPLLSSLLFTPFLWTLLLKSATTIPSLSL